MKHYSKCQKINHLVREKISMGWCYKQKKKHGCIIAPSGKKAIIPTTPSDHRAFYNFRSILRQIDACR